MPLIDFSSASTLILWLTVIVSLVAHFGPEQFYSALLLHPYYTIREHRWYQLITSGFVHAGLGHLAVNVITLYFFGPVIEATIGAMSFLYLYLFCLVFSSIPSLIRHRNNPNYATLGASGAVGGVVFAFIMFFPFKSIYLLLIPIPIPAVLFGFLFLAYSVYESKKNRGHINHDAHIAGAVAGIIYVFIAVPRYMEHLLSMLEAWK